MKKYFILIFPFLLLLSSCSIDWSDENKEPGKQVINLKKGAENDAFKKKQECVKYLAEINNKLTKMKFEGKDKYVWNIELKELFYSPIKNSCLVAYYYREEICWINNWNCRSEDYEYINVYIIEDFLSKTNLFLSWNNTSFEQFLSKIKELKWE